MTDTDIQQTETPKTAVCQAQIQVSNDWTKCLIQDLVEDIGIPTPYQHELVWMSEEKLRISIIQLNGYCLITYTLKCSNIKDFFEAMLLNNVYVPDSFQDMEAEMEIHGSGIEVEPSVNGTYSLFAHPDYEWVGESADDAPIGGTSEDWETWFDKVKKEQLD